MLHRKIPQRKKLVCADIILNFISLRVSIQLETLNFDSYFFPIQILKLTPRMSPHSLHKLTLLQMKLVGADLIFKYIFLRVSIQLETLKTILVLSNSDSHANATDVTSQPPQTNFATDETGWCRYNF